MTRTRLLIALAALASLFTATLVTANMATASQFQESISGDFWDTIDINGNGATSNVFSGATKGNGSADYQGILEVRITGIVEEPGQLCEVGEAEGRVITYSFVRRYDNGDLLFSDLAGEDTGTLCYDFGSGEAQLEIDARFTGGTGRHTDASGTYHASFTALRLMPDAGGTIGHAGFYGTTTGTLD